MIQRYQRFLAAVMCTLMTAGSVTAFAAGPQEADELGDAIADVILSQNTPVMQNLMLTPELTDGFLRQNEAADDLDDPEAAPQVSDETERADGSVVNLVFNQKLMDLEHEARSYQGITWVPVEDFFSEMGCTVVRDPAANAVRITRGTELNMELTPGSRLAQANGRCWYMAKACTEYNGPLMMPIRDAAKVFSAEVDWDSTISTVFMTGGALLESGTTFYDPDDLLWVARIVRCESGNQPMDGKIGVANVVINRMNDPGFPETAKEVIFDRRHGVQFSPSKSDKIYKDPPRECWLAAKIAFEGYETAPDCFYFTNAGRAARSWAGQHRPYFGTIGDHAFFK